MQLLYNKVKRLQRKKSFPPKILEYLRYIIKEKGIHQISVNSIDFLMETQANIYTRFKQRVYMTDIYEITVILLEEDDANA
jgi:hypothetical protein